MLNGRVKIDDVNIRGKHCIEWVKHTCQTQAQKIRKEIKGRPPANLKLLT
jgi:hypothetical protein